jgi:hypothetical protein
MNSLLKGFGVTAIIAGLGVVAPREATAVSYSFNGTICNPGWTDRNNVTYEQKLGAINKASAGSARARVTCGINLPGAPNSSAATQVDLVRVVVNDVSGSQDVTCTTTYLTSLNGTSTWSQTKSTSGFESFSRVLKFDDANRPSSAYVIVVQCDIPALSNTISLDGKSSVASVFVGPAANGPNEPPILWARFFRYAREETSCSDVTARFQLCNGNGSSCQPSNMFDASNTPVQGSGCGLLEGEEPLGAVYGWKCCQHWVKFFPTPLNTAMVKGFAHDGGHYIDSNVVSVPITGESSCVAGSPGSCDPGEMPYAILKQIGPQY